MLLLTEAEIQIQKDTLKSLNLIGLYKEDLEESIKTLISTLEVSQLSIAEGLTCIRKIQPKILDPSPQKTQTSDMEIEEAEEVSKAPKKRKPNESDEIPDKKYLPPNEVKENVCPTKPTQTSKKTKNATVPPNSQPEQTHERIKVEPPKQAFNLNPKKKVRKFVEILRKETFIDDEGFEGIFFKKVTRMVKDHKEVSEGEEIMEKDHEEEIDFELPKSIPDNKSKKQEKMDVEPPKDFPDNKSKKQVSIFSFLKK